ncbi:uncharacterized protein LOC120344586 [Styela clava]
MAAVINVEARKLTRSSKLEQTILSNRGMNIHLKRCLNVIEVDRKRMLKFVARRQRELQADLKAKKDEKFNVMLRYQMQKTQNEGKKKNTRRPSVAADIEGALFTDGLMNAPGVNHRMKRLDTRRRILPDFEDDMEDGAENLDEDNVQIAAVEGSQRRNADESALTSTMRVQNRVSVTDKAKCSEGNNHHSSHPNSDDAKSEAMIWMTSGVCSVINQDAELKQIAPKHDEIREPEPKGVRSPPITGFSMSSQMRAPNQRTSPATRPDQKRGSRKSNETLKSVRFSRHRGSLDGIENLLTNFAEDKKSANKIQDKQGQSRLSVVKSKLESNEKEFLLKLRIQNQKLENEDVARKVWDFIGKRPISMSGERVSNDNTQLSDDDTLSDGEEERNLSKYLAAASVTSRRRGKIG